MIPTENTNKNKTVLEVVWKKCAFQSQYFQHRYDLIFCNTIVITTKKTYLLFLL